MKNSRPMITLKDTSTPHSPVHFIGIGGCGMNGVARLAAHAGYPVTGSDRATDPDLFKTLQSEGIKILPQDGTGITKQTGAAIYSTAIESDNPDILKAKELGIPLLHRAEMLASLCKDKELIAVAGTAGKSTVTGLLGHIFEAAGKDPTVYCGAKINNFGSSIRTGNGPWIIEADESDRSFLNFHPTHAIITNIAEDHFELSELRRLFAQFKSQVSGTVIQNTAPAMPPPLPPSLSGKHNIENANNALALCRETGLDMQICEEAVLSFIGIERRLERIGPYVIDDFAHSPVKISAALEAAAGIFPRLSIYWRPHGYTPLAAGLDGFIEAFSTHCKLRPNDKLFILPVYYAGGTVSRSITAAQFTDQLNLAGTPAEFVKNFQTLETRLLQEKHPVLGMGARDPELPRFARRIAAHLKPVDS